LGLALIFWMSIRPASGGGWSVPGPFYSSGSESAKSAPAVKKSEPSLWQKLHSGTKKFFTDVGNALTFKKTPPKKQPTLPYNPWIKPPKEKSKSNWFTSLFETKKEKPRRPDEWIIQERPTP
jgi:hypothetical protein